MIIKRALFREAALSSLGVVAVLALLMLFMGLTQALGKAAMGKQAADAVFQILSLEIIRSLDTLLPLAMFIGILLSVSRWYRDNEMTVLAACGISPMQLLQPVMALALAYALIVATVSLWLAPLAAQWGDTIKARSKEGIAIQGIQPGVFTGTKVPGQVFYAEALADGGGFRNVFISSPVGGKDGADRKMVLVAETGIQLNAEDSQDLVLRLAHGTYYEGEPGVSDYSIVQFGSYSLRWQPKHSKNNSTSLNAMTTRELWQAQSGRPLAEFHWRVARPVAIFVLAIFALVLAYTDARRGRAGNIVAAILVFFIYSNVLGVGAGILRHGEIPPALGLWWVHALFGGLAWYMLRRRLLNRPLFWLPGRWA